MWTSRCRATTTRSRCRATTTRSQCLWILVATNSTTDVGVALTGGVMAEGAEVTGLVEAVLAEAILTYNKYNNTNNGNNTITNNNLHNFNNNNNVALGVMSVIHMITSSKTVRFDKRSKDNGCKSFVGYSRLSTTNNKLLRYRSMKTSSYKTRTVIPFQKTRTHRLGMG